VRNGADLRGWVPGGVWLGTCRQTAWLGQLGWLGSLGSAGAGMMPGASPRATASSRWRLPDPVRTKGGTVGAARRCHAWSRDVVGDALAAHADAAPGRHGSRDEESRRRAWGPTGGGEISWISWVPWVPLPGGTPTGQAPRAPDAGRARRGYCQATHTPPVVTGDTSPDRRLEGPTHTATPTAWRPSGTPASATATVTASTTLAVQRQTVASVGSAASAAQSM